MATGSNHLAGWKPRFHERGLEKGSFIHRSESVKQDKRDWYQRWGWQQKDFADVPGQMPMELGRTVLVPNKVDGDGNRKALDGKETVSATIGGRVYEIGKDGITLLSAEYLKPHVKQAKQINDYVDSLTELCLIGGDDVLNWMFGKGVFDSSDGFKPSQIANMPRFTPAFYEAVTKLKALINKHKHMVAFEDDDIESLIKSIRGEGNEGAKIPDIPLTAAILSS